MRYLPSEVKAILHDNLPGRPNIMVFSRDENEKLTPAYNADHYEVGAYYYEMGASLSQLTLAMMKLPGVYQTVVIGLTSEIDPDWPVRYRSPENLRPQVRALMRDA